MKVPYKRDETGESEARIAKDVINLFYEHLILIRNAENIDLLIPPILLLFASYRMYV